ncbi:MAG: LPS-assembly protein LptD [Desulfobulbaceae bacterium]|uniref:LPS-assembly protein LptD n=1 Tax=Candidatus Desulfatifera sulfidica TaxID=2841691 RepID=A0A8J6TDD2_9BACT|nr:LPS-assembly protein LptD [Candidatus Desulfatifera sulfidica]
MSSFFFPRYLLPSCLLLLLAFPGLSLATSSTKWLIEADQVTRLDQPKTIIAQGSVVLRQQEQVDIQQTAPEKNIWRGLLNEQSDKAPTLPTTAEQPASPTDQTTMTITADWLSYNLEQETVSARGQVTIDTGDEQIKAESGEINLNQQTGTFHQATIIRTTKELHLEGEEIHKTGDKSYEISNGWAITCKVDQGTTPPWSFTSSTTRITTGGYIVLKNVTFRVRNIPILYSPWLILPAKDQRQTGLLFPEFSNSDRSGFGLNLPLFINISDSADITLFPHYLEKRGPKPGLEFRFVLAEKQQGNLRADYLYDQLSDPSETIYYQETGYTHDNQDRYWIRGKIDHDISNSWFTRLDLDLISDRDYLDEFDSGRTGFTQSNELFLEQFGRGFENENDDQRTNSFTMLKFWNNVSLKGQFLAINDLRSDTTGPSPLWQLPSLELTGFHNMGESAYSLDWDADYVHYWREEGIGGQRIDLFPAISGPLPLSPYIESRVELGLRQTLYAVNSHGSSSWDKSTSQERLLPTLHAEIGTTLARTFALKNSQDARHLEHKIRPYIHYNVIPDTDQSDLPVFDEIDQIAESNLITYGIDNFFTLFNGNNQLTGRDTGHFKISQQYDLRSKVQDQPLSPVIFDLGWKPLNNLSLNYDATLDVYGHGLTSHSIEAISSNDRGDFLNLEYRHNQAHNIRQINGSAKLHFMDVFSAAYAVEHSFSQDQLISQDISLIYQPACWSMELQSSRSEHDTTIMLIFTLANISSPFGFSLPGQ